MSVVEMPETFDVPKTEEVDLESFFDSAAAGTGEPSADQPVAEVTGDSSEPQPEEERPIESFLPDEAKPADQVAAVSPGVDLAMREVMEQIIEQNDFIRSCEGEVEDAKAELKLAKENFDKAVERLRSLCTKLEFFRKADENDAARPLLGLQDEPAADADHELQQDEEPVEPAQEETVSAAKPSNDQDGVPIKIRVIKDVFDGGKQLLKVGDEYAIADTYEDGSVAVDHQTEGGIIVEEDEFEVIEWRHEPKEPDPKAELQEFLGCSESQVENFVEYGIGSIDELKEALSDGLASGSDQECLKVLTAVKGVGKKKAEKILELVKARG